MAVTLNSEDNKRTDTLTPEQRSQLMSRCKGKNTKPEKLIRSLLHNMGYRFRLYRNNLPGSPDIVLPKHKTVIFVHGCFWHRHPDCKKASMPKQNADYWQRKFAENVERDKRKANDLLNLGWSVIVIWQCATDKRNLPELPSRLETLINKAANQKLN